MNTKPFTTGILFRKRKVREKFRESLTQIQLPKQFESSQAGSKEAKIKASNRSPTAICRRASQVERKGSSENIWLCNIFSSSGITTEGTVQSEQDIQELRGFLHRKKHFASGGRMSCWSLCYISFFKRKWPTQTYVDDIA